MILTIYHSTIYRYGRPVTLQPHRMMMQPRASQDLAVLAASLDCTPTARVEWAQDVFGNSIATGLFSGPTSELVITNELTVEQKAAAWPIFSIALSAHNFPFDYSCEDLTDLGALRIPSYGDEQGALKAWARSFLRDAQVDTLSLLKEINAGILGPVAYRPRDEEGTQSPLQTLTLGSGSCRDIAALFIEVVRHLGFGARAVSGYLFDELDDIADPGSTHAWAEVFLPGAGWITFDPTHQRLGSFYLIPVAVARSNQQIMPIVGSYVGRREDFLAMDVSVRVRRAA